MDVSGQVVAYNSTMLSGIVLESLRTFTVRRAEAPVIRVGVFPAMVCDVMVSDGIRDAVGLGEDEGAPRVPDARGDDETGA